MSVKIGQITNADVYTEGNSLVGRFKDFQIPEIEQAEIKHETLGQIAVLSLPGRPLKEMKGKGTLDFFDAALMPAIYNPTVAMKLALHSYVDVFGPDGLDARQSHRLVTNVSIMIRKVGGKAFKLGDAFEGEFEYSCLRFVQGLPGQAPIIEADVMNQVYRVNGKDVWPLY